jgi:hypothetical protein
MSTHGPKLLPLPFGSSMRMSAVSLAPTVMAKREEPGEESQAGMLLLPAAATTVTPASTILQDVHKLRCMSLPRHDRRGALTGEVNCTNGGSMRIPWRIQRSVAVNGPLHGDASMKDS